MVETSTEQPALANRSSAIGHRQVPELLAPAGDWECARAGRMNGADAIYFGLEKFNARMRAHNFTAADLPGLMEFLHRRGVKGYVTFNTLIFEDEMAEAEEHLRAIIAAGVDAAIVQDVGICRLIRRLSPDFPIHASTQMTVTSAAGVAFARELGCNLVVLARECSIKEIGKINAAQIANVGVPPSGGSPGASVEGGITNSLPLEVFVHGALCVAYSGQCLTSEALGGRSANRGECAQACRMPYELISDGKPVPLGDRKYLLSPQDLAGLELLPDLARAGVVSLKIEGRLKSPEYVANITRIYRKALDEMGGKSDLAHTGTIPAFSLSSPEGGEGRGEEALGLINKIPSPQPSPRLGGEREAGAASKCARSDSSHQAKSPESAQARYDLEMAFSRGLYTGWMGGINNQQLVHARFGKKRGVYLGEVAGVGRDHVRLHLEGPLKRGDGIVFDAGKPEDKEEGGRVYEIRNPKPEVAELHFGHGDIDFSRIKIGDKLWKTSDPELDRRLRQSFEGETPKFQRPIHMEAHGLAGKPLTLIVRDETGHLVKSESSVPLTKAEKHPLTSEKLREQLGRLGGTPFKLGTLENNITGEVMLPVSELNRLRREAVAELERLRAQPKRWTLGGTAPIAIGAVVSGVPPETGKGRSIALLPQVKQHGASSDGIRRDAGFNPRDAGATRLIVLVRNLPQLEAAIKCGVLTVYCEFENLKKYREAVTLVREATPCVTGDPQSAIGSQQLEIFVAPPRIFKMGEEWTLDQVRSCNADGYLVRNYDHLKFFANDRRVGDFSLNVANRLTADYFRNKSGLERITASYDLNFQQLQALLRATPPEWFEITIHQHIPMFHMEHCVFCAFLSKGTDYTNCGRPCDVHDVRLRDRVGAEHPLKADVGCRNTVFNSMAQTGAEYVEQMLALGARNFRIEFLNETPEQVGRTVAKYRQLLRGEITGTALWRELKLMNQLGVTRGQMGGP